MVKSQPTAARVTRCRATTISAACLCLGLFLMALPQGGGLPFILNVSPSVPVGLYLHLPTQPTRGAVAVIRLPKPEAVLAQARGYLPISMLLIKKVAAEHGDFVCRSGSVVTINGRIAASARSADLAGGPLPAWRGCKRLLDGQIFVLSRRSFSFDSRYFGVLDAASVLGTAKPIWTLSP